LDKLWSTLTGRLVALIMALTLPVTGITAFALGQMAWTEQERYAREAVQIAGFVSKIVDNELSNLAAVLEGASNSTELRAGNFAAFHAEASRLVAGREQIIVLRDHGTEQIVNTAVPYGNTLPPAVPLTDAERAAFEAGKVVVGSLYHSPLSGELRIPVALPIEGAGRSLILAITAPARQIARVLELASPPGWVLTVGDANGAIVARSEDNERYAGEPALASYLEQASGNSGSFRIVGFGGRSLLTGYAKSALSGWLTGANIPTETVEAPLWRNLAAIAAVALIAAVMAALISLAFVRRFRSAAAVLLDHASSDGKLAGARTRTGLVEFDGIIDALSKARLTSTAAEQSLSRRTQELQVVLDTVPAAVWFTYDRTVQEVRWNAFASRLLRVTSHHTASIASGAHKHLEVYKDNAKCTSDMLPLQRIFRGETIVDEEYEYRFQDGTAITILTSAEPLEAPDGSIVGAVSVGVDISDRKRNEVQQRLLINELNHRVKNTITTVQSIARRTLRTAASLTEADRGLADRLVAVSQAYDVLTREKWEGSRLRELVTHTLGGYGLTDHRIRMEGPEHWLSAANSVTLSLVLHELAVNATKYGALSVPEGAVDIEWTVSDHREAPSLSLRWSETGGPTVAAPQRQGFGMELLKRLSESGGMKLVVGFEAEGFTCTITIGESAAANSGAASGAPS
jgi:two-component sensor histidine kinase